LNGYTIYEVIGERYVDSSYVFNLIKKKSQRDSTPAKTIVITSRQVKVCKRIISLRWKVKERLLIPAGHLVFDRPH
jgi:hypothetical protein